MHEVLLKLVVYSKNKPILNSSMVVYHKLVIINIIFSSFCLTISFMTYYLLYLMLSIASRFLSTINIKKGVEYMNHTQMIGSRDFKMFQLSLRKA